MIGVLDPCGRASVHAELEGVIVVVLAKDFEFSWWQVVIDDDLVVVMVETAELAFYPNELGVF